MHGSCFEIVKRFEQKHVRQLKRDTPLNVLDVGSYDVNGTYKPIFLLPDYTYTGIDITPGPNVDRVVEPYNFGPEQYDVVISGSCMEHVEDIFAWARALMQTCRVGGTICVTAPHTWPQHRHPVDCWRIYPDGMRFAFRELKIFECECNDSGDTWIYATKTKETAPASRPAPAPAPRENIRSWRKGWRK
jgi:hypothetical protein